MLRKKSFLSLGLIIILQVYSLQGIIYAQDYDVQSQENVENMSGIVEASSSADEIVPQPVAIDTFLETGGNTGDDITISSGIIAAPIAEPLEVIYPTESILIDQDGRVDVKSLKSVYTKGGEAGVTYCSLIARTNIEQILRASTLSDVDIIDSIDRGDALDIINKGLINSEIKEINIDELKLILENSKQTLYDIYFQDIVDGENISHRATLVLGTDGLWYVLDPLRGLKTIEPQEFNNYINSYESKDQFHIFLGKGYNPMTVEKTILVPHDTITQAGEVSVEIQAGEITVQDQGGDSLFDAPQDVLIEKVSENKFIIGDTKSHLEFSKPAKIEIVDLDFPEGFPVDITVLHEGEESYSNVGITLNENAICDAGISSDENNVPTVHDGKIVFYTCGASTFNISPSAGTATITSIISGTNLNNQLPLIGGTGSVNGASVTLSLSGGVSLGTGMVSNGQWFIQPTSNLGLGNHTICVGSNCININIITLAQKGGNTDGDFSGAFANAVVNAIAYQPDGNIILGGAFTTFNGVSASRVVRVTTTGAIDPNFTGVASNTIQTITLQPDGKALIGGGFVTYNGVTRNRLVRITTTGVIDTTFAGTFATNGFIYPIIRQPDGKIVAGGSFTTFNGGTVGRLARVTATGATDPTFTGTFASNGTIFALLQQSDGKILVGGSFTGFNGVATNGLIRLTETGATDTSFTGSFLTSGIVNSIVQQPDGKILVGGLFTGFNGVASNSLVRITTTGAIDTSFTGSFTSGTVNTILVQPDGKILVGGSFNFFNGATANRLIRLTSTGARDTSYVGTFGNAAVSALGLQLDGKVLVGGSFTTFNSSTGSRIVRLGTNNYMLIYTGSTGGILSGNTNQNLNFNDLGTTVQAIANTGYTFSGWSDGYTGISRTDNAISDIVFTALFTINTYTLTYTGSTGGVVSGNLLQLVNYNTTGTIVAAVPDLEYTFSGWSDGYTGISRTDISLGNKDVVALFNINKYILEYTGTIGGSISGTAIQNLDYNTTGSVVEAITNTGYTFSGWSDGYTGSSRQDVVTGNKTLTALFTINTYTLTYSGSTGGVISGNGIQFVDYNTTGSVVTAVADTGYTFSGWNDGYTGNSRQDLVTGNKTLTALFTINTYTLTYSGSTGGVISGNGIQFVDYNTTGSVVTAVADTGYTFSGWSDGYTGSSRQDLVTGNKTLTALFTINTYTLTYSGSTGGVISGNGIQFVDYNTTGSVVTAVADTGYTFSGWSDGYTGSSRQDLVTGNKTLTALFTINTYGLIYTGSTGGVVSGSTIQLIDYNTTGTIVIAISNLGYTFSGWSDGYTGSSRQDLVTGNKTLTALFTINTYTLTYSGSTGGIVSGNLLQLVDYNTTGTTITAIPDVGYTFSGWSDGYTGISRTDVSLGDIDIIALFTLNIYALTYNSGIGGTISGTINQNLNYNTTGSSVEAITSTGYTFSGWSDGYTGTSRQDVVTGNKTITALFTINQYTLTYTGSTGGIVSGTINQNVNYNAIGSIVTAVADTGYTFSGWSDGSLVASRQDIVTGDKTLIALFTTGIIQIIGPIDGHAGGGGTTPIINPIPTPTPEKPAVVIPQFQIPTIQSIETTLQSFVGSIIVGQVTSVQTTLNPALQTDDLCYTPKESVNIILGENTKNKDQVVYQSLLRAYGLTKYSQTDIYMPEKGLTREEAAKMFVNFARNVLCRKPQFVYNIPYTDMEKADPTLKEYIKLAYEYGIMKGGQSVFRPTEFISKDEFIAALMRTLLGKYLPESQDDQWYQVYNKIFQENGYESLLNFDELGNNINRYTISKLMYTLYYNPTYQRTDIGYRINR